MNKMSERIDAIIKYLGKKPLLCVFVPCIAFEAPATAYFTRAGQFSELLIIFGLFFIQPILYIVIRRVM